MLVMDTRTAGSVVSVPQDIKLSILDGNAVLTKGSKVYLASADNNLKEYTLTTDATSFQGGTMAGCLIFYCQKYNNLYIAYPEFVFSGATEPINPIEGYFWLDTESNVIKIYVDNVWKDYSFSLPIGTVTVSNSKITDITQVFNGLGYMGLVAFALPGLTGLVPDFINPDGTSKYKKYVNNNVIIKAIDDVWSSLTCFVSNNSLDILPTETVYKQSAKPAVRYDNAFWYSNHKWFRTIDAGLTWSTAEVYECAVLNQSGGKIGSINVYQPYKSVTPYDLDYKFQVVSALPAVPNNDTFYFIPE